MADKKISDFSTLPTAQDSDLILVSSSNETYNMQVGTLKQAAGEAAIAAVEAIADEVVTDATAVARSAASAASGSATQAANSAEDASDSAAAAAASAAQVASSYVQYDDEQSLTTAEQAQARENIGSLAADWGSENEGKALVVDTDGSITTGVAGISDAVKTALLACFEKVAWIDGNGQDYYGALYAALDEGTSKYVIEISATYTPGSHVVKTTDSLDSLRPYIVVTAEYSDGSSENVSDYALSGTLNNAQSTITIEYDNLTTSIVVTVDMYLLYELPEPLVITSRNDPIDTGIIQPGLDSDQTILVDFTITSNDLATQRYVFSSLGSSASTSDMTGSCVSLPVTGTETTYNIYGAFNGPINGSVIYTVSPNQPSRARVAITYTASNGGTKIIGYNNSGTKSTKSASVTVPENPSETIKLGAHAVNGTTYINGTIHMFKLYRRKLTDTEIAQQFGFSS